MYLLDERRFGIANGNNDAERVVHEVCARLTQLAMQTVARREDFHGIGRIWQFLVSHLLQNRESSGHTDGRGQRNGPRCSSRRFVEASRSKMRR